MIRTRILKMDMHILFCYFLPGAEVLFQMKYNFVSFSYKGSFSDKNADLPDSTPYFQILCFIGRLKE